MDKEKEQEETSRNEDQDIGKENDLKRIIWTEDMLREKRVGSVGIEKEEDQEGKYMLLGQEDNMRKEEEKKEEGLEGKREKYLKGEVMEIDICNHFEGNTRISLQDIDQNVMQIGRKDKEEIKKAG